MGFVTRQTWVSIPGLPLSSSHQGKSASLSLTFLIRKMGLTGAIGGVQGSERCHPGWTLNPSVFFHFLGFFSPSVCPRVFPSAHKLPPVIPTSSSLNHQPNSFLQSPTHSKKEVYTHCLYFLSSRLFLAPLSSLLVPNPMETALTKSAGASSSQSQLLGGNWF